MQPFHVVSEFSDMCVEIWDSHDGEDVDNLYFSKPIALFDLAMLYTV
jgi:hypothetical protein